MDIKIENGDIAQDITGREIRISGFDEIVQRVKIACSVKKGDFPYDRELGVDTGSLDVTDERLSKKLDLLFEEAVIRIPGVRVAVESASVSGSDLTARITISYKNRSATTEVTLYGII